MMSIGRSSRRENLLWVTGVEPMLLIRTHLANHIRASSREEWLHQQARHMTAPDRNRRDANSTLDAGRRPHMTQGRSVRRHNKSVGYVKCFCRADKATGMAVVDPSTPTCMRQ